MLGAEELTAHPVSTNRDGDIVLRGPDVTETKTPARPKSLTAAHKTNAVAVSPVIVVNTAIRKH